MIAITNIILDSNILKLYGKTPHYNGNNFMTDFQMKWLKIKVFKKT